MTFSEVLCVGGALVGGSLVPKEDFPPLDRSQVAESVAERKPVEMILPVSIPALVLALHSCVTLDKWPNFSEPVSSSR